VDPAEISWLMGPFGNLNGIEDRYVDILAAEESLVVKRNEPGFGLLDSIGVLSLSENDISTLQPEIADFYEHTLNYEFEVWSQWRQIYRPFAGLITRLFSRRLGQLNLPLNPLDTAPGIRSQIYKLVDPQTDETSYTVWYRHLKSNGRVIFSGVYSHCATPDGKTCIKVICPLPRGNATVVMSVVVGQDGSLSLISRGKKFGDPGFYFLLKDAKGQHWARYVRTFHESLRLYVDDEHVLRADHVFNLWGAKAFHLHYRINPILSVNPTMPSSIPLTRKGLAETRA
jgi:hypothetical protein